MTDESVFDKAQRQAAAMQAAAKAAWGQEIEKRAGDLVGKTIVKVEADHRAVRLEFQDGSRVTFIGRIAKESPDPRQQPPAAAQRQHAEAERRQGPA